MKYLRAIYSLTLHTEETGISYIADFVGVSKASASIAIRWLTDKGLVEKYGNKHVALTEDGNDAVVRSYDRRETIYKFLALVLGVPEEAALADADRLAAIVSNRTLCVLCREVRRSESKVKCEGCTHCFASK